VARFHAKLAHLGFSIAPETRLLMRDISRSGELATLSAERIWREFSQALNQASPQIFIQTLRQCEALVALLPELDRCFDQHDNMRNVASQIGQRTVEALTYSAKQNLSGPVRWSLCLHGINYLSRAKNIAAKTIGPEPDSNDQVNAITQRLKVPNEYSELALLAVHYCDHIMQAKNSKPDLIIDLFDRCDVWRRPERFEQLLYCCEALSATNHQQTHTVLGSITFLRTAYQRCLQINTEQFVNAGLTGKAIGESLRNARKICLAELKQQF
jgi:tRNA nucleotidyltransferase (CCA-adding enzyme)